MHFKHRPKRSDPIDYRNLESEKVNHRLQASNLLAYMCLGLQCLALGFHTVEA